ncbi:MAG: DEAD/DEAH box helicase, partial [Gemmatimonadaceae bacterium]
MSDAESATNVFDKRLTRWFSTRKWKPFPFQREVWDAYANGESGLIHAATGTGKTYAAWLGPVLEALAETPQRKKQADTSSKVQRAKS